jgi:hypothetical protein
LKFIFIDEIEQPHKKAGFFAVSGLVVDSRFYAILKRAVDAALGQAKWRREEEFKGRYIFSSSKGDTTVGVEARIEIVRGIVAQTTAKKNARARYYFAYNEQGKSADNYLGLLAKAIARCPKPESRKGDKTLAAVFFDQTNLVKPGQVEEAVRPVLSKRGFTLIESPVPLASTNETAGLIAADVLAFLKSWDVLFPDPGRRNRHHCSIHRRIRFTQTSLRRYARFLTSSSALRSSSRKFHRFV